jgi:hypothetical protein
MNTFQLILSVLPDTFALCRLNNNAQIPEWALAGKFFSITRTLDELSIVCPQDHVPEEIQCEKGWRCLKVEGRLDLSLTGILASLAVPLAQAGISIFAVSTYETDYILVKEIVLEKVVAVLIQAGHQVFRL